MSYISNTVERLNILLNDCPDELIDLYGLLVLTKGESTSLKDVHEAWGFWKNRLDPSHKSLIEFDRLTPEVQELDRKYMEAIHAVARQSKITNR